jgi:hypothetical protein
MGKSTYLSQRPWYTIQHKSRASLAHRVSFAEFGPFRPVLILELLDAHVSIIPSLHIGRGTRSIHLRVNFWPAMTGAAVVDFEFALPHMAHAVDTLVSLAMIY